MPMVNCYVDEESYVSLMLAAADLDTPVDELCESAIENAAAEYVRNRGKREPSRGQAHS
jgi:hypothetical protein